jgi:hypothetical protein
MRALRRYFLAPLVLAAALFSAGGAAYHAAASPHRATISADPICPYGSNWDVTTQSCK